MQNVTIEKLEAEKQQARNDVAAAERELSQTATAPPVTHSPGTTVLSTRPEPDEGQQPWSPQLVITLGLGFLGFSLIVLILMTWCMRHIHNHAAVLRAFGLLLIVSAAVFLVIVGYGERQLAPVLGLLGTIAGYLLGKGADRAIDATEIGKEADRTSPAMPGG